MGASVTYSSFPTLTPTETDPAVGGIHTSDKAYCRHCMYKLGIGWENMKYLTYSRSQMYIYNCVSCGWRITKKRMYKMLNG